MEVQIKTFKKYWYETVFEECSLCGKIDKWKHRVTTGKCYPVHRHVWCGCL